MADAIKNLDLRSNRGGGAGGRGRHYRRSGASIQGTLSNWITSVIGSKISEREKRKVADRAWDLYLNDAMGHGIIEGLVTQVVNIGLTPQPTPMLRWLGKDGDWQKKYTETAYDLFEIWGLDTRNWCDATQRCNIYMLQALALFMWKLEGIAAFQVIQQKANPLRPLCLSLLPIDPGRLVTPTNAESKEIYDGIEIGKNGEIKAGHVLKPGKPHYFFSAKAEDCTRIPAYDEMTGLPNLLIVCDVRNVAEYRQDSILGCMIKEIKDSNDLVDAALVKTMISNLWTLFVESDAEATRLNTLQGSNEDPTSSDWDDRVVEFEKGTTIVGKKGEKPTFLSSDAPGPGYDTMNKSIVGRLGMATGRGPENINHSYQASYSASRANIEDAAKFDDYDRMILANRFCQPVMAWLQYEAALRGILPVTSIDHFRANLYAYTRTEWLPPPLRPIDHQKEAKADTERLNNGTKTYAQIYGERSENWRVQRRQVAIERKYDKELEEEFHVSMSATEPKTDPPEAPEDAGKTTDE